MELGAFGRALRRRWYLVVVLLILTGAATYLVAQRVGPTYEATGTTLVFPPSETRSTDELLTRGNPYLNLSGVNQARDVMVRSLTSKSVGDEFGERFGPDTSYEVVPDYTNSAPIILFTVESTDPETSIAALAMLMDKVPLGLKEIQAGLDLPAAQQVSSQVLTADERPTTLHKAQLRSSILAAAVCTGLGLLLIGLIDVLLAARRREPAASAVRVAGTDADAGTTQVPPKKGTLRAADAERPERRPRGKAS